MNIRQIIPAVLVASTVSLVANEALAATTVCEDFNSHSLGPKGTTFVTLPLGFTPPFYVFQFQDLGGVYDLEVTNYFVDQELDWSYKADMSMADPAGNRPFDIEFDLYVYASPVTVEAYELGGGLIFSQVYNNGAHAVTINSGNRIERVELRDGDNETWIDNVCASW